MRVVHFAHLLVSLKFNFLKLIFHFRLLFRLKCLFLDVGINYIIASHGLFNVFLAPMALILVLFSNLLHSHLLKFSRNLCGVFLNLLWGVAIIVVLLDQFVPESFLGPPSQQKKVKLVKAKSHLASHQMDTF